MNNYTRRVARRHQKYIFALVEHFASLKNGFLLPSSRSQAEKMNNYTWRATQQHQKWIFACAEWLDGICCPC